MDFIKYSEFLLRKFRERQEDLMQSLAAGGAQDYVQYQRIVGEISGLNFAEISPTKGLDFTSYVN